jgi:predicted Zn-dependent protease
VRAIGLTAAIELMMGGTGGTLANAGVLLAQLSYTRAAEREADQHALGILSTAGIATKGFADFFRRVVKLETETDLGKALSKIEVLRTHPMTEERIAEVEKRPTYPATPAMSAEDWSALKSICKDAGSNSGPTERPGREAPSKPVPGRDI